MSTKHIPSTKRTTKLGFCCVGVGLSLPVDLVDLVSLSPFNPMFADPTRERSEKRCKRMNATGKAVLPAILFEILCTQCGIVHACLDYGRLDL